MPSFTLEDVPFKIHVIGERTKKLWSGEFRAQRFLSHRQLLARDRLIREYLGDASPDTTAERGRATALADCMVALTKVPNFWSEYGNGMDLVDENVLIEVWNGLQKVQNDALQEASLTDEEKKALKEDAEKATKDE